MLRHTVGQTLILSRGLAVQFLPTLKDFTPHRNLARIIATRGKTVEDGQNIDWATAETLAFRSLVLEKKHVRLSGQDVKRGTFSQRHTVIHDQNTEEQYIPLNDLSGFQAKFRVCNSSLSEFVALEFELGYSLVSPDSLTIWRRNSVTSPTTRSVSSTNSSLLGREVPFMRHIWTYYYTLCTVYTYTLYLVHLNVLYIVRLCESQRFLAIDVDHQSWDSPRSNLVARHISNVHHGGLGPHGSQFHPRKI